MNTHESVLPEQINPTTFRFQLQHWGNLTNFQFCSHPMIIDTNPLLGHQTVRTPNMAVTQVSLCVDEMPICHIHNHPTAAEETHPTHTIDPVHYSPCEFFYNGLPLLCDLINSANFCIVVTFAIPPQSVFWLEYDNLNHLAGIDTGPMGFTVDGRRIEYRWGQIVIQ